MKGFTKRAILAACVGAAMLITVGCGSNQSSQSTQLTYNGSSTLAPVISKIATDFTEKIKLGIMQIALYQIKILLFMYLLVVLALVLKRLSMVLRTSV